MDGGKVWRQLIVVCCSRLYHVYDKGGSQFAFHMVARCCLLSRCSCHKSIPPAATTLYTSLLHMDHTLSTSCAAHGHAMVRNALIHLVLLLSTVTAAAVPIDKRQGWPDGADTTGLVQTISTVNK